AARARRGPGGGRPARVPRADAGVGGDPRRRRRPRDGSRQPGGDSAGAGGSSKYWATARKVSMPHDFSKRRKPRFKLPQGACDAHNHVFGPAAKFPSAPERRYTPQDAPKEVLTALHALLGVERAVIVQASCHGKDNRAMLDAIADAPDKRRGVAFVDDGSTEKHLAELDRGGVRGVRFNFVRHLGGTPDMDVFHRVIDRIKGMGWHVVLHTDAPDIVPLTDMMKQLPLPFVIDHMGRVDAAAGTQEAAFPGPVVVATP